MKIWGNMEEKDGGGGYSTKWSVVVSADSWHPSTRYGMSANLNSKSVVSSA